LTTCDDAGLGGGSATTTTTISTAAGAGGGGDAVGAGGGGFGKNAFQYLMQAQRNVQSDQQPKKRKQQRQHAVDEKKAPMKKNNASSSSFLPVSNGGDSQTARATTPRMTPTGPTMMMLESQALQRSHFERSGADQMMMMNSPTMNSPPPTTMTAYAGGYTFDAGEDVLVFDEAALAALASKEEENKSELLQKAETMNDKTKRCRKRDIILEEDAKTVISLEGAAGYVGEEHLGEEQEYIDLTIEGDPQITAEMNELRIESSNQAGTSLPTPIAEREDAVDVLTAACEKLPMQFTGRVTNWLDEECPGTKPLFRLKDNSCASTIFKYDLSDRDKPAELEKATTDVLNRIKSECLAGTAVVQKSVHLAFAPLVPEGGSQYRMRSDDPLLKSPTARGLESSHKKFWEVYDFKCSPETKFLYVVTGNVWMEASYVRIGEDQQEGDRVPAEVHELFKAEGDENFGNLPPRLWVPCFAEIYMILAEITTSVRVKGGEKLKNFIFAIDTAKGAKALFNAAKSIYCVSDAYFLALFPVYGTGMHPSLIVRKWCLWLYAARLLAMCAYYRTGEILGGQTIPHASSYPEPGRGRVQVPPQQQQWPPQWPRQQQQQQWPPQWPRQQQQWPRQQHQQQWPPQWPRQPRQQHQQQWPPQPPQRQQQQQQQWQQQPPKPPKQPPKPAAASKLPCKLCGKEDRCSNRTPVCIECAPEGEDGQPYEIVLHEWSEEMKGRFMPKGGTAGGRGGADNYTNLMLGEEVYWCRQGWHLKCYRHGGWVPVSNANDENYQPQPQNVSLEKRTRTPSSTSLHEFVENFEFDNKTYEEAKESMGFASELKQKQLQSRQSTAKRTAKPFEPLYSTIKYLIEIEKENLDSINDQVYTKVNKSQRAFKKELRERSQALTKIKTIQARAEALKAAWNINAIHPES